MKNKESFLAKYIVFVFTIFSNIYHSICFHHCYINFQDNGETAAEFGGLQFFQGAQFPFSVNEKVLIKVTNISQF
jgi:hypothetical protein